MELTLTPRLAAIADCVPDGARLADVGTDHGYLPASLLLSGKIKGAVASDLRPGPLRRARETAARYGMEERISFRLCDGLAGIRGEEADTVAVAGMGGETIASILAAAPWTRDGKQLLLQPMTHGEVLRGWLAGNGYTITAEHIAREGARCYCVLEARGGHMEPLNLTELWVGRQSGDPLRGAWLDYVSSKLKRVLDGQLRSKAPERDTVEQVRQVLKGIERMKREL